jgi:hypothetical protein
MRPLTEPRLVNDAFGDPALYVDLRDERRALLFDLGDVGALAPRQLLRTLELAVLAGAGAGADTPITVAWRDAAGAHCRAASVGELTDVVLDVRPDQRIGCVTDPCIAGPGGRGRLSRLACGTCRPARR